MVKVIELNGRVISEVDVQFMELSEIQSLIDEIQTEVFKTSKQKKEISNLPACKKTAKTHRQLTKMSTYLIDLHEAMTWVGRIKKQKRDTSEKERAWYKKFYQITEAHLRKGSFQKLIDQTNIEMNYTIN